MIYPEKWVRAASVQAGFFRTMLSAPVYTTAANGGN
jgi:hypothetical protein